VAASKSNSLWIRHATPKISIYFSMNTGMKSYEILMAMGRKRHCFEVAEALEDENLSLK
jgi:hypothetical protein